MRPAVLLFATCALACLVAHVAILLSTVRARARSPEAGVPRPRALAELVWAILPIIALALVLTATWARVNDAEAEAHVIMKVAQ